MLCAGGGSLDIRYPTVMSLSLLGTEVYLRSLEMSSFATVIEIVLRMRRCVVDNQLYCSAVVLLLLLLLLLLGAPTEEPFVPGSRRKDNLSGILYMKNIK